MLFSFFEVFKIYRSTVYLYKDRYHFLRMTQISRHRLGQRIEKIGRELVEDRTGFLPEHSLTLRMLETVNDFPDDLKEQNVQVIPWGGGLYKDYDQTKYWQGEYVKEYKYTFLIPYQNEKTKVLQPFLCSLHFTKFWYRDEHLGRPELMGQANCNTSLHSEDEILEELAASGWEMAKDEEEWKIREIRTGRWFDND